MITIKKQKGVGLVEVLVALLLLAVGVLGYAALQLRAVDASSEAMARSQALLVMRGLTESIRSNVAGQGSYPVAVRTYTDYKAATEVPPSCLNTSCTPALFAAYDAYQSAKAAFTNGIRITMNNCPGVSVASVKRQCLFAAWGDTEFVVEGNGDTRTVSHSACMLDAGIYVSQARCIMMEAY